jgi:flagellin
MAQIINTNIPSLNAQRNLTASQSSLAVSLERLSTGLRINSAKDDAAGLAIAERFTTQIRGLNQAIRNANDGISFAQTAEGALGTVGDALQRIRELAVQAANDSNSASDRTALDNEVQQLVAEVGRIANSTEFNGQKILDGSLSDLFFQVGANQGQTIAVSGVDSKSNSLGAKELVGGAGASQTLINDFEFDSGTPVENIVINIDTDALDTAITVDLSSATSFDDIVRLANEEIQSRATDGSDDAERISDLALKASLRVDNSGNTTVVFNGNFDSDNQFTVDGGLITFDDPDATTVDLFDTGTSANVDLTAIDVTTREDAFKTIAAIDGALTQVNGLRAELGSVQIRFESTIANLSISAENLSASRSRIQDADFAAETANLTRAQILQQAGTAILGQANALPQNVLSLLG